MNQETSTFGGSEKQGYTSIMMLEGSTRLRLHAEESTAKPAPMPEPKAAPKPPGTPVVKQALWASIFLALLTVGCCWAITFLRGH